MIVAIQQGEFGLPISARDQPDLADVDGFYRATGGEFWVATDHATGDVVGTVAAVVFDDGQVALRKMFVTETQRGSGLAAQLMRTVLDWADSAGHATVWLGTTSVMHAAHRFYARHGFEQVEPDDLPDRFPRMAVDSLFFRRRVGG